MFLILDAFFVVMRLCRLNLRNTWSESQEMREDYDAISFNASWLIASACAARPLSVHVEMIGEWLGFVCRTVGRSSIPFDSLRFSSCAGHADL